jgi:hypothetical protein
MECQLDTFTSMSISFSCLFCSHFQPKFSTHFNRLHAYPTVPHRFYHPNNIILKHTNSAAAQYIMNSINMSPFLFSVLILFSDPSPEFLTDKLHEQHTQVFGLKITARVLQHNPTIQEDCSCCSSKIRFLVKTVILDR